MKLKDKIIIWIIIILIIIILGILGIISFTGELNIAGFTLKVPVLTNLFPTGKDNITMVINKPPIIAYDMNNISIIYIKNEKEIYKPGETAKIYFRVDNGLSALNVPYNITVDWFYNNQRIPGWKNVSTEMYNVSTKINDYSSWIQTSNSTIGDWEVQVVLDYNYSIYNFTKDSIIKFKVL